MCLEVLRGLYSLISIYNISEEWEKSSPRLGTNCTSTLWPCDHHLLRPATSRPTSLTLDECVHSRRALIFLLLWHSNLPSWALLLLWHLLQMLKSNSRVGILEAWWSRWANQCNEPSRSWTKLKTPPCAPKYHRYSRMLKKSTHLHRTESILTLYLRKCYIFCLNQINANLTKLLKMLI